MATVFIPTMLQSLTGGVKQVDVEAANVRQIIDRLDELYPRINARLVDEGRLQPNLRVAIHGEVGHMGLLEKMGRQVKVHIIPATGGGRR